MSEHVPQAVTQALEGVLDPEIPVLTIRDLGILRGLRMEDGRVVVTITPTYSGCPAMLEIRDSIAKTLTEAGIEDFRIETNLAPAWTTDWMSEEGKQKLLEYGIAPPSRRRSGLVAATVATTGSLPQAAPTRHDVGATLASRPSRPQTAPTGRDRPAVACPQCGSANTSLISEFGSTPCKALYRCNACSEPFDHFKCH